jgi:hypothetical protein
LKVARAGAKVATAHFPGGIIFPVNEFDTAGETR